MSEQTTTEKQATRRLTIFRIFKRAMTILGVTAAMFCFNIVYEPFVQSQINYNVVPEPIVIPPHPEISIIAEYQTKRNSKLPEEIAKLQAELIVDIAVKNKIPTALIVAMVEAESTFNPFEVSKASAKGLLQILRCDGINIDPNKAHNLEYNIQTGISILQIKLGKTGNDLSSALQAYSGGSKDYARDVYTNIGRYSMFREREK